MTAASSSRRRRARIERLLPLVWLLVFLAALGSFPARASSRYPGKAWEKAASPEKLGWSSEKLKEAWDYSATIHTAAVMIVANGVVLDEWGDTTTKYNCHSIRKSYLSALYGIFVKERRIDLSRTLEQLGIDDNEPSLTPEEKQATVLDLLKARSGVYHPALYETDGMKAARPRRWAHAPGTFWYYNNWDFNVLGTIFNQQTHSDLFKEFKARIAAPLQMEDFNLDDTEYIRGADSIHPAYPFRMTARDTARFGLLYLRKGKWAGRQIVPEKWVEESTKSYSDAGDSGGYGYLWWVAVDGKHFPGVRLEIRAYSARGAGGHYILIVPAVDLVIVHRVNTDIKGHRVSAAEFGKLLKMILDARKPPPTL